MSPFFPRRLPFHITLPETSLWYNLEVSATRFPNRAALSFGSASVSYREFRAQAEALAGYLQKECGIRRGDRVALFMHNSPQFVIAYYGILRADAVVVPVNCMNTTGELEQLLLDAGASTIVTVQELQPRVEPLLAAPVMNLDPAVFAAIEHLHFIVFPHAGDDRKFHARPGAQRHKTVRAFQDGTKKCGSSGHPAGQPNDQRRESKPRGHCRDMRHIHADFQSGEANCAILRI